MFVIVVMLNFFILKCKYWFWGVEWENGNVFFYCVRLEGVKLVELLISLGMIFLSWLIIFLEVFFEVILVLCDKRFCKCVFFFERNVFGNVFFNCCWSLEVVCGYSFV